MGAGKGMREVGDCKIHCSLHRSIKIQNLESI